MRVSWEFLEAHTLRFLFGFGFGLFCWFSFLQPSICANWIQNQNTALERHVDLSHACGFRIQKTILIHFLEKHTGFPMP